MVRSVSSAVSFAGAGCALGLLIFTCACGSIRAADDAQPVDPERFEKELLVSASEDPMQLVPLPDGTVLFIERNGNLKRFNATDQSVQTLGTVPTVVDGEYGLMGLALAPDFEKSGWLYLDYCPSSQRTTMRLSRFTLAGDRLDLAHLDLDSERKLFDYTIQPEGHMGGGLEFDPAGNLYFGTGDNSPPLPEVPLDDRPGRLNFDVLRTSGNTADLRGKVLRIHPEPDGTYTIPKGNLFPDGDKARPEIFAMGCRNPFRLSIDPKTGWVYWGDVGPNISPDVGMGPTGYDEINQARAAGNFGWPMFVGPNEPFRILDFETRKVGAAFDPKSPINGSRNNTGRRELPPPQPAFIWYPTTESREFPELGSGARCSMAGPIYYFDARLDSPLKLPQTLDHSLLIYDWTRNWIKAVKLDGQGGITHIEPFMSGASFRKPMDLKLAADGTLYLIEYGDKWQGNRDAQIVRIVYRRGNRPPVAVADATPTAGKQPLVVQFDAHRSFDKDGDALKFAWNFGDSTAAGADSKATISHQFDRPGTYHATLVAIDAHGATSHAPIEIRVGNSPPKVTLVEPAPGGFFDWNQRVPYRAQVDDEEDGGTADGKIAGERVLVRAIYQPRHRSTQTDAAGKQVATDDAALEPGLALMRRTTCFSCHTAQDQSAGPPYATVATKYADDREARERLAQKILTGGVGVWGARPMPPHPQHTIEQTRQMVDWVLSLRNSAGQAPVAGSEGVLRAPNRTDEYADAGVFLVTATYTDQGADGAAPLTGEATTLLHARRKRPAFADARHNVEMVDILEGERGIVGRFLPGGYASFEQVNLRGIDRAVVRWAPLAERPCRVELRCDGPRGTLLGSVEISPERHGVLQTSQIAIKDPGGVHDFYLVAMADELLSAAIVDVSWIEFHDATEVVARKASEQTELAKLEREVVETRPPARPFVRTWKIDDLAASLDTADRGRSFDRGQQLFKDLACAACHKMRDSNMRDGGGNFGPDMTEVAARMRDKPSPRLALLTEIIEPSKIVGEKFRTHVIATADGRRLTGLVVKETAETVTLADNPLKPDQVTQIPVAQIDERSVSTVSMMPTGLVDTLSQDEILDLLLFVESGGDAKHPAFGSGK